MRSRRTTRRTSRTSIRTSARLRRARCGSRSCPPSPDAGRIDDHQRPGAVLLCLPHGCSTDRRDGGPLGAAVSLLRGRGPGYSRDMSEEQQEQERDDAGGNGGGSDEESAQEAAQREEQQVEEAKEVMSELEEGDPPDQ